MESSDSEAPRNDEALLPGSDQEAMTAGPSMPLTDDDAANPEAVNNFVAAPPPFSATSSAADFIPPPQPTVVESGNRDDTRLPRYLACRKSEDRRTTRYLTKYERARIIGTRALQIAHNAPIMVETTEKDPLIIAEAELKAKTIPMIVRRYLPDGTYEDWPVKDLIIE